ncbi:MAG: DNA repair protein RadC [Kiritimatiellia bacterium]
MKINGKMKPDGQKLVYRLHDLPPNQRPRELLERFGVAAVQDEVLLAIILRSGISGANVLELARKLLQDYGSLTEMAAASERDLRRPGIGPVKAQILKAALELGRRLSEETITATPYIRTPANAAALLRPRAQGLKHETFWVLLLNSKNRLQGKPLDISRGLLDASLVHPREVFRSAIREASAAVILAHNHPSGDPSPSPEDLRITRQLVDAGRLLSIRVLDHIILGRSDGAGQNDFLSIREAGLAEF